MNESFFLALLLIPLYIMVGATMCGILIYALSYKNVRLDFEFIVRYDSANPDHSTEELRYLCMNSWLGYPDYVIANGYEINSPNCAFAVFHKSNFPFLNCVLINDKIRWIELRTNKSFSILYKDKVNIIVHFIVAFLVKRRCKAWLAQTICQ